MTPHRRHQFGEAERVQTARGFRMAAGRAGVPQLLRRAGLGRLLDFPLVLDHGLFNFLALDRQGRRVCAITRGNGMASSASSIGSGGILRLHDLLLLDIIAFGNELHVDQLERGNRLQAREAKEGRDADMRQEDR